MKLSSVKRSPLIDRFLPPGLIGRIAVLLSKYAFLMTAALATTGLLANSASAQAIATGDIFPNNNPSAWTDSPIGYTPAYIGNYGVGALSVTNGATVTDFLGVIGYNAGASGTVTVSGPGSSWSNYNLTVGNYGTGSLSITNGGLVAAPGSYITLPVTYVGNYSGSNGMVTVAGSGSTWTNGALYVGYSGTGSVSVLNGGTLATVGVYLGSNPGASGTITIDGSSSTWTNSGDLIIGPSGMGVLNITNGSAVTSTGTTAVGPSGTVNFGASGGTLTTGMLNAASNQFAGTGTIVTHGWLGDLNLTYNGPNVTPVTVATWTNPGQNIAVNLDLSGSGGITGDISVGYQNSGSLTVQNGAQIISGNGYVGSLSGSTGIASVSGQGSKWTNSTALYVGNSGTGTLSIANGGTVSSATGYVGYNGGSNGTVTVSGPGSAWTNSGILYVGNVGTGAVTVNSGGALVSAGAYVGAGQGSNGTVTVSGPGSAWTNSGILYVGNVGTGAVTVNSGGALVSAGAYLGSNPGASGTITIDGSSSTWTNSGDLIIGPSGMGVLNITNGSAVTSTGTTTVGPSGTVNFGASGGTLTTGTLNATSSQFAGTGTIVTHSWLGDYNLVCNGPNSAPLTVATWKNANESINVDLSLNAAGGMAGNLAVGYQRSGSLTVENGAQIASALTYIGYYFGSSGTATVSGSGSTWTLTGDLHVGESGTGSLSVMSGAALSGVNAYLGYNDGATGTVTVSGAGSSLSLSGALCVGNYGSGALNVANGASVANGTASIGSNDSASGTVTVSGTGSSWTTSGDLVVGLSGTGSLNIAGGGAVSVSATTTIGPQGNIAFSGGGVLATGALYASPSQLSGSGTIKTSGIVGDFNLVFDGSHGANQAIVVANGTTVDVNQSSQSVLGVGYYGSGSLNITNGQNIASSAGYLGYNPGSSGTAAVSGQGSTWNDGGNLYVGYSGAGVLSVTNGASVISSNAYIGNNAGSSGVATVSGTGSTWTNNGLVSALCVGVSGPGALNVLNGGAASAYNIYLGTNSGITGTAVVDGAGSTLTGTLGLYVGYDGNGVLNITNGGNVVTSYAYVGYPGSGTLTVDGAGSTLYGGVSLTVGTAGAGTLNITNGATVFVRQATTLGALGTINFGADGGTLTTSNIVGNTSQIKGTGTVVVGSYLGDADWVMATPQDLVRQLPSWTGPGQNINVYLNLTGNGEMLGDISVGYQSSGSMAIKNGVTVAAMDGYVGYNAGSIGAVTISGAGSTWFNGGNIYVGNSGTGAMTITNGGGVAWDNVLSVGYNAGSTGSIAVSGTGSTLGKTCSVSGYRSSGDGLLRVGDSGTGSLTVINGASVVDEVGDIAENSGSSGAVIISGPGSTWSNSSGLAVGKSGRGTLSITNGATVTDTIGTVGYNDGAVGIVTVDGPGSTWTNTAAAPDTGLWLGLFATGQGSLSISDGGTVTANAMTINTQSLLTVDVGKGSSLVLSDNEALFNNYGTVRLVAGASAAPGTYAPIITAGTWYGTGAVQALGGVWNAANHTVTVNAGATAVAGSPTTFDLCKIQRVLVADAFGKSVGAGFQATTTTANLTFSAADISGSELSSLQTTLNGTGQYFLSGWTFSTTGYTAGNPVYLSLFAGSGQNETGLTIWDYANGTWSQFAANDLAYDGAYASFTSTNLNDYAVTGAAPLTGATPTPIPGALLLFGPGLAGLIGIRKRIQGKKA